MGAMTAPIDRTKQQRRVWDRAAPTYDRQIAFWERTLFGGGREWLGERAVGRVLEVAVGTGRNLPHYRWGTPDGVTSMTAIDLSAQMIAFAQRQADELGIPLAVSTGDAEALPYAAESFDTVVCALALCSIPEPQAALHEMRRVLAPGGRLLLIDHVSSTATGLRVAQRAVEKVTVRLAGEYFTRRQLPLVESLGFEIVESERLKAGIVERVHAIKPPR